MAARAGVSQQTVSRLERGDFEGLTIKTFLAIADALDADVPLAPRLRGPRATLLRDRRHAALQNAVADELRGLGWAVLVEESFNHYGDRGSVDVLGWHAERQTLLVIEVKTEILDLQDTLRTLDMKARVLPIVCREAHGWRSKHVAAVLVVAGTTTQRKALHDHAALIEAALPAETREVRRWLADPSGPIRGVLLVRNTRGTCTTPQPRGRERVRLTEDEVERLERRTKRSGKAGKPRPNRDGDRPNDRKAEPQAPD